ncbi:MAG: methyltransferase domain-containing protein, partial [Planctomycetes bacterium]|nr:methyltransferase domain-containing protein [Planctomycetota bacterium]
MELPCKSNSKPSKPKVLLLPLEFATWRRAKSWSYATQLGFEEGLLSNNIEFFTIPVLQEVRSSSPASWLHYAQQLCKNKKFDQVWIWLVHTQLDEAFLEWVKDIAPIRVGFLMESMEYNEQDFADNPGLRGRKELVENQMRYMTHILADEADAERINKQGVYKAMWYPSAVPERFLATSAVVSHGGAVFCGAAYGQRAKLLKHHSLKGLLVHKASEENSTEYPRFFDELNHKTMNFLQQNRTADEALLTDYLNILRNIRQECFKLWLNGLQTGCAIVNLPHFVKSYAGRVIEAMSAGRPVISWEIPNRPRNKALFENGKEILLFDKSKPEQLANHIRHIQNNPNFARQMAENALKKVGRFHTIEKRIQQVLDWIKTGKEPTFGDKVELKQDNQQTLLVRANAHEVEEQSQNRLSDGIVAKECERDSHLKFGYSTTKKSYFIKSGYRCNIDSNGNTNPYLDDVPHASSYQAAVYRLAAELIKENEFKNVLDVGCGFGIKLAKYIYPVCHDITGIDCEHAIRFCKREHNFGKWFTDNIEKPSLHLDRKFDLIISSDVIEHLVNPDTLLEYIKSHSHPETTIVLSTPERDMIQGKDSFGPPANKTHVREWNMAEFHKYISEYGFNILEPFLAKDKDDSAATTCQVFLCKPDVHQHLLIAPAKTVEMQTAATSIPRKKREDKYAEFSSQETVQCKDIQESRMNSETSLPESIDEKNSRDSALNYFLKAQECLNKENFGTAVECMRQYRSMIDYSTFPRIFNKTDKSGGIDVSVIIVSYNRTEYLKKCLESLSKQDDANFEVIVVDNGESDFAAFRQYVDQYIKCPINFFLSEGRNIGACCAKGKIIAFLDDDALVQSNY